MEKIAIFRFFVFSLFIIGNVSAQQMIFASREGSGTGSHGGDDLSVRVHEAQEAVKSIFKQLIVEPNTQDIVLLSFLEKRDLLLKTLEQSTIYIVPWQSVFVKFEHYKMHKVATTDTLIGAPIYLKNEDPAFLIYLSCYYTGMESSSL